MEEPSEETIKEEPAYVEPDQDLSEKITQQVQKLDQVSFVGV